MTGLPGSHYSLFNMNNVYLSYNIPLGNIIGPPHHIQINAYPLGSEPTIFNSMQSLLVFKIHSEQQQNNLIYFSDPHAHIF